MNRFRSICRSVVAVTFAITGSHASAHEEGDHEHAPKDAISITSAVRSGAGDNLYESVPNWCLMPDDRDTIGSTHGGIVVDKKGQIYFSMDGGTHGLLVYTPEGKYVAGLLPDIRGLHGLSITTEGKQQFIYAAHLQGQRGLKITLDGKIVQGYAFPQESGKYKNKGQYRPTAIAVLPTGGDVYIADGYGQNWIHRYGNDGKYKASFGGPGTEPGKFKTCHGMQVDMRGKTPLLLIADRENRRLQHFDMEGNFVSVVTTNLRRPCSISFHGDRVVIAELEARVTILDKENKQVAHLGDNAEKKQWANFGVPVTDWKEGIFTAPHGVAFDASGNIYVMDWNKSGRLTRFNWIKSSVDAAKSSPLTQ